MSSILRTLRPLPVLSFNLKVSMINALFVGSFQGEQPGRPAYSTLAMVAPTSHSTVPLLSESIALCKVKVVINGDDRIAVSHDHH
jgi:hypothetical protein